jgi:hypothetical protein
MKLKQALNGLRMMGNNHYTQLSLFLVYIWINFRWYTTSISIDEVKHFWNRTDVQLLVLHLLCFIALALFYLRNASNDVKQVCITIVIPMYIA